jgi:hypothetical protein
LIWTEDGLALMEPLCDFSTWSGTVNDTVEYLAFEVEGVEGKMMRPLSDGCGVNGEPILFDLASSTTAVTTLKG